MSSPPNYGVIPSYDLSLVDGIASGHEAGWGGFTGSRAYFPHPKADPKSSRVWPQARECERLTVIFARVRPRKSLGGEAIAPRAEAVVPTSLIPYTGGPADLVNCREPLRSGETSQEAGS